MLDRLIDVLLYIPRVIFSAFVDGLIFLFNAIPPPAFLANADLSGFHHIGYFIDILKIDFGFAIVLSALLARFLLRRIPFIG